MSRQLAPSPLGLAVPFRAFPFVPPGSPVTQYFGLNLSVLNIFAF